MEITEQYHMFLLPLDLQVNREGWKSKTTRTPIRVSMPEAIAKASLT